MQTRSRGVSKAMPQSRRALSNRPRARPGVALALALWLAGAAGAEDLAREWIDRPGEAEGEAEVLVIDRVTRRPVPGARLRRYGEMTLPRALFLDRFTTGPDGRALLRAGGWVEDTHWLVDAPGYAPTHEYGCLAPAQVELARATPVWIRILDALGRPLPGAEIDAFAGCGHAPSMARFRADAEGAVTVGGVDPRVALLWPLAEGCESEYLDLHGRERLDGSTGDWALVLGPGGICEGVVTDGEGRPLAEAWVTVPGNERGPEMLTGADGRFRLVGGREDGGLRLSHPLSEQDAWLSDEDVGWRSGHPLRVRLTRHGTLEWEAPGPRRPVEVHVAGVDGDEDFEGVTLVRLDDGRAFDLRVPADPEDEQTLPVGRYVALDRARAPRRLRPAQVEILPGARPQRVDLVAEPLARLRRHGTLPPDAEVFLALPWRVASPDDLDAPWEPAIEADAPAALRVEWLGAAFFFPVGPARDGVRDVTVRLPEPHRVQVRRADGTPPDLVVEHPFDAAEALALYEGELLVPARRDGTDLLTFKTGVLHVRVVDQGRVHEVPVTLPPAGAVAQVRLPGPEEVVARLVEVRPDPADPAPEATLSVWDRWGTRILKDLALDAHPGFLLHGAAGLEVERPGFVTRRVLVDQGGTVTVRWPATSLTLRVAGAGPGLRARVGRDEFPLDAAGVVRIRGLEPGPFLVDLLPPEGAEGAEALRLRGRIQAGQHLAHAVAWETDEE